MTITFDDNPRGHDTAVFEAAYEPALRLDPAFKVQVLRASDTTVYMFVDGVMAGETYGASPSALGLWADEELEDTNPFDRASCYCYSTTVLPAFQGKGLGKLLKAFWLGKAAGRGYDRVLGHATSEGIVGLLRGFGAEFSTVHKNWQGSPRTAVFYTISLIG